MYFITSHMKLGYNKLDSKNWTGFSQECGIGSWDWIIYLPVPNLIAILA